MSLRHVIGLFEEARELVTKHGWSSALSDEITLEEVPSLLPSVTLPTSSVDSKQSMLALLTFLLDPPNIGAIHAACLSPQHLWL